MFLDFHLRKLQVLAFLLALTLQVNPCRADWVTAATVDLPSYGWAPQARREVVLPFIAVDHRDRVLVGYATRERTKLVTRDKPSLDLRILRFSENGKLDLSLSLPTSLAGDNGIYLSDSDQIIVRANDTLQLYQEDTGAWKVLAPCGSECRLWQSVTRRTLAVRNKHNMPILVIHLSPVPRLEQCEKSSKSPEDTVEFYPKAITDKFAYYSGSWGAEPFTYRWPFCEYDNRVELPLRGARWDVLNDNMFVLYWKDSELKFISSRGVFDSALGKHEYAFTLFHHTRSNEQGSRIAVDIETLRGGNAALDISSHPTARRIGVYDFQLRKEVASIPVSLKRHGPFGLGFGMDLSPNGDRLAILDGVVLKMIDLDDKHKGSGDAKLPAEERR